MLDCLLDFDLIQDSSDAEGHCKAWMPWIKLFNTFYKLR